MAILLFFCLFVSMQVIPRNISIIKNGKDDSSIITLVGDILFCILWSLFYYLS